MNLKTKEINNRVVAFAESDGIEIKDVSSALDFLMNVSYETNCDAIALNKEAISEDFFSLRTGLAGEVLQKFINYKMKFAIVGDFSKYESKALRDFIFESNNGKDIFFLASEQDAVQKLETVL